MSLYPFHLAIPVRDINESRHFYGTVLDLSEGRSSDTWVDYNFYGHQFVIHLDPTIGLHGQVHQHFNPVDNDSVPVPHFGVVLSMDKWRQLAERLRAAQIKFLIEPRIRFQGQPGEQGTLFFLDPSGNALEFKGFDDLASLFKS